jgi:predicted nuclease of restriction endonuclease-like (RecB) superfamily
MKIGGNMLFNSAEYIELVNDVKTKIGDAQNRAVLAVNNELTLLYWNIGTTINDHSVWGNKFIENLARDIKHDFPDMKGYSVRNLKYMAKFAKTYTDLNFVQRTVAQIPWRHNIALLDKIKNEDERNWYIKEIIANGWSRDWLVAQIENDLYRRQETTHKVTNFDLRLASPQRELIKQSMKDPYIFDFIENRDGIVEREIEKEMVGNVTRLLLELGTGFSFVGNQYHLEVENKDFYIDLLFYHLTLHCYVVIELKNGDFKPEYAGKLNFYVSAVDDLVKTPVDNPTIGIILCKNKEGLIAEYSLKDIDKPIGVSEFKLLDKLPKQYEDVLPTAEDIELRLGLSIDDSEDSHDIGDE